jgi:hypothetical protein
MPGGWEGREGQFLTLSKVWSASFSIGPGRDPPDPPVPPLACLRRFRPAERVGDPPRAAPWITPTTALPGLGGAWPPSTVDDGPTRTAKPTTAPPAAFLARGCASLQRDVFGSAARGRSPVVRERAGGRPIVGRHDEMRQLMPCWRCSRRVSPCSTARNSSASSPRRRAIHEALLASVGRIKR